MMPSVPPLAHGVLVLLGLELALFVLSRIVRRLRVSWLLHAWILAVALVAALARTPWVERWHGAWTVLATAALLLTGLALFALVDAAFLQVPHGEARRATPRLVRDVLRIAVLVPLVLFGATRILGFELSTVLVSSTVLSAVVGFALQDVLKSVVAGVALQVERSLSIGDWILLDGTPAQVMEMSWRSTKLRTNEDVTLLEPNTSLVGNRITSYGPGDPPVALLFRVGLPYAAPPERVKALLVEAARHAPGAAVRPEPQAFVDGFHDSAVGYAVRVWTHDVGNLSGFRDGVLSRTWYVLQRGGISIPFPIRTVHLHHAAEDDERARAEGVARVRALLGELPLFRGMTVAGLDRLAHAACRQHHAPAEVVVREGEPGDSLFIVERGRVRVGRGGGEAGASVDLAELGPGSFFGEMSLLTGAPRSATVVAETAVEVLVLSHAAVAAVLAEDPALAEGLSTAVAARAAHAEATMDEAASQPTATDVEAAASVLARIRAFFGLDRA
jgi:small-conductance mechanosensitive channel/CRP-like cAMP-binding protein